jgi:5-methylcytosine-specific restriction protein A
MELIKNKEYRRRELHEAFGGQQRGGISTPAEHKMIFLFTGESGSDYGYKDGWAPDGLFNYTGEGQRDDMQFIRGNAAIRDHLANGKTLHLFEDIGGGQIRYLGEMTYHGHLLKDGPDIDGKMRKMIVFQLKPVY